MRGYDSNPTGLTNSGSFATSISSRKFLTFKLIGLSDAVLDDGPVIEEIETNNIKEKEKEKGKGKEQERKENLALQKQEKEKNEKKKKKATTTDGEGPEFSIVTPSSKRQRFQALTLQDREKWVNALRLTIHDHNVLFFSFFAKTC